MAITITQPTAAPLNPLSDLNHKTRAHWQAHRPKMYLLLERSGILEERIEWAVAMTTEEMHELEAQYQTTGTPGTMPMLLAWEATREKYCLLRRVRWRTSRESDPLLWQKPESLKQE